jgi:S-adenosylmethionine-diacylglycerol 3-amino-3-carboxypropyl transferase
MVPDWVRDGASWPLAFAQVREDARIDLEIASRLGDRSCVAMVASGGCTAAAPARRRITASPIAAETPANAH